MTAKHCHEPNIDRQRFSVKTNDTVLLYYLQMNELDDKYQRITLRIPKELHEKLTSQAKDKSRSMNAEIVHRLEESFQFTAVAFSEDEHAILKEMIYKRAQERLAEIEKNNDS